MKEGTEKFLAKASRALRAADSALNTAAVDLAAGRAYYAMLYAAKALLNERGLRLRAHAAVCAAFGREFGTAGSTEADLQTWFDDAYRKRGRGTDEGNFTFEEAEELIAHARAFVQYASRHVRRIE